MAQQVLENAALFGVQRQKINDNFTELFTVASNTTTLTDFQTVQNKTFTNTDGLTFNLTPSVTTGAVGKLLWNDTDGTLDLGLKGGNVTLQVGQEQVQRVVNKSGSTLQDGEVVYITGAIGNRLSVTRANASSEITSGTTLGVVTENILNNQEGFVTVHGLVRGLNTAAFAEGSSVYLSTTDGAISATKPIAPNHTVTIGFVVRSHVSQGSIFVNVMNGLELDELHDVYTNSKQNNQLLRWNSSNSRWENTSSINSVVIGSTTPAAGSFTTLSASGTVTANGCAAYIAKASGTLSTTGMTWCSFQDTAERGYVGYGSGDGTLSLVNFVGGLNFGVSGGVIAATLDSSGNLGLGVTPSAWASSTGVLQMQSGVSYSQYGSAQNAYYNAGYKCIATGGASLLQQTNGQFLFYTAPSGTAGNPITFTQAMMLDASGQLGIGTTSPAYRIHAAGTGNTTIRVDSTNGQSPELSLFSSGVYDWRILGGTALRFVSDSTERARINSSGNLGLGVTPSAWGAGFKAINLGDYGAFACDAVSDGSLSIANNAYANTTTAWKYTSPLSSGAGLYSMVGATHKWYTAPSGTADNPITFTQAMTLDAGGNLLVRQTSTGIFNINGAMLGASDGTNVFNHSGTPSGREYHAFGYNGSAIGSITQNGTTAVAYNTTSDHRLKENVRPANAARFNDIEFVDFEWVDGRHDCGVIAHQLQSVYPDLVLGEKDAVDEEGKPVYQQVNYIGLIARMGSRIQQLESRLYALEAKL